MELGQRALKIMCLGDVPGGPVVKNLAASAGGAGSIPGRETKILCATGKEACTCNWKVHESNYREARGPQQRPRTAKRQKKNM